ncbi:MAG: hypothetical protein K6G01_09825 [Eubacterium sp.]|nr:hypothetical protein [Eubacterium sp.]
MFVLFIWIIFIVLIVVSSVASKNKADKKKAANKQPEPVNRTQEWIRQEQRKAAQAKMPKKQQQKSMAAKAAMGKQKNTVKGKKQEASWANLFEEPAKKGSASDILARANRNVNEDFSTEEPVKPEEATNVQTKMPDMEEMIRREQLRMREENEDLMATVQDLMIKGPDTEIRFARDFVAEGMDMVNKALL